MKKLLLVFVGLLVLTALACNLSGNNAPTVPSTVPENTTQENNGQTDNGPIVQQANCPTCPEIPTPEPPAISSNPVMINEGLSSLDSYIFQIRMKTTGPGALDTSEMINETHRMNAQSATYTRLYNSSTSTDYPEPSTSTSEMYRIGTESCSVDSGTDFSFSTATAAEDELSGLMTSLVDFNFVASDPVLVGSETMNGIASRHYTFSVPGLGAETGLEVTANLGEYWIAEDGNYLVKYSLLIEMRSSPEEISRLEFASELTQVNQPVDITFPQGCLDAKAAPQE